jgi:hypothetical protein
MDSVCKSERAPDLDAVLTRINLIADACIPPPQLHALDAIHGAAAQRAERYRNRRDNDCPHRV